MVVKGHYLLILKKKRSSLAISAGLDFFWSKIYYFLRHHFLPCSHFVAIVGGCRNKLSGKSARNLFLLENRHIFASSKGNKRIHPFPQANVWRPSIDTGFCSSFKNKQHSVLANHSRTLFLMSVVVGNWYADTINFTIAISHLSCLFFYINAKIAHTCHGLGYLTGVLKSGGFRSCQSSQ